MQKTNWQKVFKVPTDSYHVLMNTHYRRILATLDLRRHGKSAYVPYEEEKTECETVNNTRNKLTSASKLKAS